MASTIKISDTITWAEPFINYLPLSQGINNQPALFCANMVAQAILNPPFHWRWNRQTLNFNTVANTQDYLNAPTWVANTAYAAGAVITDSNGKGQKALTAGTSTNGSQPTWSAVLFASTTDNTITWQNIGPLSSIPAVNDFGYIEKASVQDTVSNSPKWIELQTKLDLSLDSSSGRPAFISAQTDNNSGVISFRTMPVAPTAYPISITYQKKQSIFTGLNQSWAPIPDEMFHVYSWGFLAMAYLLADDARFGMANQKFITHLLSTSEGLTQTEQAIWLESWRSITDGMNASALSIGQGVQARGAQ